METIALEGVYNQILAKMDKEMNVEVVTLDGDLIAVVRKVAMTNVPLAMTPVTKVLQVCLAKIYVLK